MRQKGCKNFFLNTFWHSRKNSGIVSSHRWLQACRRVLVPAFSWYSLKYKFLTIYLNKINRFIFFLSGVNINFHRWLQACRRVLVPAFSWYSLKYKFLTIYLNKINRYTFVLSGVNINFAIRKACIQLVLPRIIPHKMGGNRCEI